MSDLNLNNSHFNKNITNVIKDNALVMRESSIRLKTIAKKVFESRRDCTKAHLKVEEKNIEWKFLELYR